MSEIRYDRISATWSIIAPKRGHRPAPPARPKDVGEVVPPVRDCPFCPGNERLLPSIIQEIALSSHRAWQVRVVPNRYPVVDGIDETGAGETAPYQTLPGHGHHEVIIEHPRHDQDLATMSHEEVSAVLDIYRARYRALMDDPRIECVVLFRNRGGDAGASLGHPHSQAVALGVVPPLVRHRAERSRRYHELEVRCPYCDIIAREREEGRRLVLRSDHFVAVVPFAAAGPFEVRLFPLAHRPSFGTASDAELGDLSGALRRILGVYRHRLDDPEYNLVIHSAPRGLERAPYLHWYLQFVPRLTTAAGFELGSGIWINPSVPETDADLLAKAVEDCDADGLHRPARPGARRRV